MKIKSNVTKSIAKFLVLVACATSSYAVRANIYTDNKIPKNIENRIEKIVNAPSHLAGIDNFERKPKIERIKDNIEWYKKHNQINNNYNRYGLDIKNYRNQNTFLEEKELKRYAVHHGNINPENYLKLMNDKILFEKIVKKHCPELIPKTFFKFKGQKIIPTKDVLIKNFKKTKSAFDSLKDGKYFIKEVSGTCGNNAMILTKKNNNLSFRHVTKGEISLDEFWETTKKKNYMVQEHIENHEIIKKLSPFALSTIRIVTTRFHNDVHILSADMRVSCQKDAVVDNFHKHGAIVHVNTKTGKLAKYAHKKQEKSLTVHPISNIKFENYKLPYWKETLEMVKKLHNIFPGFSSLGWDVAITPTGPKIIEGNSGWDRVVPQVTIGGIKEKWEHLKNI